MSAAGRRIINALQDAVEGRITAIHVPQSALTGICAVCKITVDDLEALASGEAVIVPVVPTEAMQKASALTFRCDCGRRITQWGANAYAAMLRASRPNQEDASDG